MFSKKEISKIALFVLVMSLAFGASYAAIPQLIPVYGKLTNFSNGEPIIGNYVMNFSIYNASSGGTLLWNESQTVSVIGEYNVYLGNNRTLNLPFNDSYWLEIKINNGTGWETLTPRQRLAAAPYAYAGGGWYLTGTTVSLLSSTNNVSAGVLNIDNTNNKINIGTATPYADAKLYVYATSSMYNTIIVNSTTGKGLELYANLDGITSEAPDSGTAGAIIGNGGQYSGYFSNNVSYGFYGESPWDGIGGGVSGASGKGIYGNATNTTGATYGVYGQAYSNSGTGVYGEATSTSGTTYGVVGNVTSASGYSGYFEGGKGVYVKSGNINTTGALNLKDGSTGTALYVNNKEALWSDNTYFRWGEGVSYNFFADNITIGTYLTTPPAGLRVKGESVMLEKGKNLVPDPDLSNTSDFWRIGLDYAGDPTVYTATNDSVTLPNGQIVNSLKVTTSGNVSVISGKIPMDPKKAYRFSIWMKANSTTNGTKYFGAYIYNSTGDRIGIYANNSATANNNPYFWSGDTNDLNWHYWVGYIFPSNGPTIWTNPLDTSSLNLRNNGSATDMEIRFLNYYNFGNVTAVWFAMPRIEEVDSDTDHLFNDTALLIRPKSGRVLIGTAPANSGYLLTVNTTGAAVRSSVYGNGPAIAAYGSATTLTAARFAAGGTWFVFNSTGFYSNGTKSAVIRTAHGDDAYYFMTEAQTVDLTKSGEGKLVNGIAKIDFGYPFNESISDKVPVRVLVTPTSECADILVTEKSTNGFTAINSDNCPKNATFDWYVIARRIHYGPGEFGSLGTINTTT